MPCREDDGMRSILKPCTIPNCDSRASPSSPAARRDALHTAPAATAAANSPPPAAIAARRPSPLLPPSGPRVSIASVGTPGQTTPRASSALGRPSVASTGGGSSVSSAASTLSGGAPRVPEHAICVALQVRPMTAVERAEGCERLLQVSPDGLEVVLEMGLRTDTFGFDAVYGTEAGGAHSGRMYGECVRPLVDSVFDGVNATVFAYGQTGAGKSYTMGTDLERCQQAIQEAPAASADEATNTPPATDNEASGAEEAAAEAGSGASGDEVAGSGKEEQRAASEAAKTWRPVAHEAIDDVCSRAQALRAQGINVEITCSFIEIHQDSIRDLLAPSTPASARSGLLGSPGGASSAGGGRLITYRDPDPSKDILLVGLEEVRVANRQQLLQCLVDGIKTRRTATTNSNAHSSRSHAVFTIRVRQSTKRFVPTGGAAGGGDGRASPAPPSPAATRPATPRGGLASPRGGGLPSPRGGIASPRGAMASPRLASPRLASPRPASPLVASPRQAASAAASDAAPWSDFIEDTTEARLHLVDLAGSERVGRSGVAGVRLAEACSINQGLLALSNVIDALAEKRKHVPYRDHVLTRLLRSALGGSSRTLMCACISPADLHVSETLSTLRYASRARSINNLPVANCSRRRAELGALKSENETLKIQVKALQAQLERQAAAAATAVAEVSAGPSAAELSEALAAAQSDLEAERTAGAQQEARITQLAAQLREAAQEKTQMAESIEALRAQVVTAHIAVVEAEAAAAEATTMLAEFTVAKAKADKQAAAEKQQAAAAGGHGACHTCGRRGGESGATDATSPRPPTRGSRVSRVSAPAAGNNPAALRSPSAAAEAAANKLASRLTAASDKMTRTLQHAHSALNDDEAVAAAAAAATMAAAAVAAAVKAASAAEEEAAAAAAAAAAATQTEEVLASETRDGTDREAPAPAAADAAGGDAEQQPVVATAAAAADRELSRISEASEKDQEVGGSDAGAEGAKVTEQPATADVAEGQLGAAPLGEHATSEAREEVKPTVEAAVQTDAPAPADGAEAAVQTDAAAAQQSASDVQATAEATDDAAKATEQTANEVQCTVQAAGTKAELAGPVEEPAAQPKAQSAAPADDVVAEDHASAYNTPTAAPEEAAATAAAPHIAAAAAATPEEAAGDTTEGNSAAAGQVTAPIIKTAAAPSPVLVVPRLPLPAAGLSATPMVAPAKEATVADGPDVAAASIPCAPAPPPKPSYAAALAAGPGPATARGRMSTPSSPRVAGSPRSVIMSATASPRASYAAGASSRASYSAGTAHGKPPAAAAAAVAGAPVQPGTPVLQATADGWQEVRSQRRTQRRKPGQAQVIAACGNAGAAAAPIAGSGEAGACGNGSKQAPKWYAGLCRSTAAEAVASALEATELEGADWAARRQHLVVAQRQQRVQKRAAAAEEARAALEATPGSVVGERAGDYCAAVVAEAAAAVAAECAAAAQDDGPCSGDDTASPAVGRYLEWAMRVASQQAELTTMIEAERAGLASLNAQLAESEAAARAAAAGGATADAHEARRLELQTAELRTRRSAHTARRRQLMGLQRRLEGLRLEGATLSGAAAAAAIVAGGGEEQKPLSRAILEHAEALGLQPWEAFAGMLAAASALRVRAEAMRARAEEAESESLLQQRLVGLAEGEASELREQLASVQASLDELRAYEARCQDAIALIAEARASQPGASATVAANGTASDDSPPHAADRGERQPEEAGVAADAPSVQRARDWLRRAMTVRPSLVAAAAIGLGPIGGVGIEWLLRSQGLLAPLDCPPCT